MDPSIFSAINQHLLSPTEALRLSVRFLGLDFTAGAAGGPVPVVSWAGSTDEDYFDRVEAGETLNAVFEGVTYPSGYMPPDVGRGLRLERLPAGAISMGWGTDPRAGRVLVIGRGPGDIGELLGEAARAGAGGPGGEGALKRLIVEAGLMALRPFDQDAVAGLAEAVLAVPDMPAVNEHLAYALSAVAVRLMVSGQPAREADRCLARAFGLQGPGGLAAPRPLLSALTRRMHFTEPPGYGPGRGMGGAAGTLANSLALVRRAPEPSWSAMPAQALFRLMSMAGSGGEGGAAAGDGGAWP
jgi:hypothetical protein